MINYEEYDLSVEAEPKIDILMQGFYQRAAFRRNLWGVREAEQGSRKARLRCGFS